MAKRSSAGKSEIEELLAIDLRDRKIPFFREVRFHPERLWRFDFCLAGFRIGIECEGGTWTGGRHTRGVGFAQDCEKYNAAARLGWFVYRFDSKMVKSGEAGQFIQGVYDEAMGLIRHG